MRNVYLDNQSATRMDERVLEEMLPFLREFYANPQSLHSLGSRSKEALEKARGQVAALVGAGENEIYFTSCGSESNNLAIKGLAEAYRQKGRHLVISSIEHFSVLNAARRLEQAGFRTTLVPVDRQGLVSPGEVEKALTDETILVSIQHANPEIGTIQPLEEIAEVVRKRGVLFHTDAVCTAGILPVDVKRLGVDLLTIAPLQFYGPRGTAALYLRKGVRVIPQIDGGVQEDGRRAGTENLPGIVGMGKACEIAQKDMEENVRRMLPLRDRLVSELPRRIEHLYLNGHPERRLPGNVNFSVEFVEGEGMLLLLDMVGIAVTSGSACTSRALKASHVISAIGVDAAVAQGSVLMSLSRETSAEDIEYVLDQFPPIVKKLRDMSPLYAHFLKTGTRREAGPGTDYEHHHEHDEGAGEE